MELAYHSRFKKQYKKLKPAQRKRFAQALELFQTNPYHPDLYNHALTGEWLGFRSVAFGGGWRAHYEAVDRQTVQFVAIGTHAQLYKG